TDIAAATSNTYAVQAADIGARIRVGITATNASGSTQATSIATPVVVPQAPVNVTPPAVTGTVAVDNYLTVSNGTWSSSVPITYTHRWERCDAAGANCTPIPGVTSRSYQVQTAAVAHRIRGVT